MTIAYLFHFRCKIVLGYSFLFSFLETKVRFIVTESKKNANKNKKPHNPTLNVLIYICSIEFKTTQTQISLLCQDSAQHNKGEGSRRELDRSSQFPGWICTTQSPSINESNLENALVYISWLRSVRDAASLALTCPVH